jgi:hypothetical protein
MVFDGYEVSSSSPDEIQHDIIIGHEFAQIVSGPKPFLKTFKQLLRFGRTDTVLQERTAGLREPSQLRTDIFE